MNITPVAVRTPLADLARSTAVTLASILSAGAGLMSWRWLAGALVTPLSVASLASVGLVLTVIVATGRLLWRCPGSRLATQLPRWSIPALFSVAIITSGLTLSIPGSSLVGLVMLWGLIAFEECWAWGPTIRQRCSVQAISKVDNEPSGKQVDLRSQKARPPIPTAAPIPRVDEQPDREVTQQMTRSLTADGSEVVTGWLRVVLAVGQRVTSLHVAFCPPFRRTPHTMIEQVDGPEVRVKKVQVLPYGARFDLKLVTLDDTPAVALLRFSAESRRSNLENEGLIE